VRERLGLVGFGAVGILGLRATGEEAIVADAVEAGAAGRGSESGGGVALAMALDFLVMARDGHLRVPDAASDRTGPHQAGCDPGRPAHLGGRGLRMGLGGGGRRSRQGVQAAMALAIKVAAQPPLSVAMTKLTVNRLAHALDDLASHVDVDQSRWQASARITRRVWKRFSATGNRALGDAEPGLDKNRENNPMQSRVDPARSTRAALPSGAREENYSVVHGPNLISPPLTGLRHLDGLP
jgi:hypothetical protein